MQHLIYIFCQIHLTTVEYFTAEPVASCEHEHGKQTF